MPSVTCFGICRGVAKWKDPDTGLHCTVCGGSGVYSCRDERTHAAEDWDAQKARQAASAQRRLAKTSCIPKPDGEN